MIVDSTTKKHPKSDWEVWLKTNNNIFVLVQIGHQATEAEATKIINAMVAVDV